MTTVNINTNRARADVVDDAYRLAVHEAGARRFGKYEPGYSIDVGDIVLATPNADRSRTLQALLLEIEAHGDRLDEIVIAWSHETKDGHTVYPKVALT